MTRSLFSLDGKVALITGPTRGIGHAMSIALAEAGADICLLQRDTTTTQLRDKIKAMGRQCHIVWFDASDNECVKTTIQRTLKVFATFDILVNNAGILRQNKAEDFLESDWDASIQVNLKSVWQLSQAAANHFLDEKKPGKIISMASILSYQGSILSSAYATTKGGLVTMIKALANEWAEHGICVNGIAPGFITTELNAHIKSSDRGPIITDRIPCKRWGTPDDLKGPVVFLASKASDYIHGEVLVVDGGWLGR